jgi:carbonic anhydrase
MTAPGDAWAEMLDGNARFIAGTPAHPHQDVERRAELAGGQYPRAALFGCSDSRLAAEIIFDQGLGDLFVIRNAGQVSSDSVLGSLEYAVAVLKVPLIVVLGHDSCGAVRASIDAQGPESASLPAHVRGIVQQIAPAVRRVAMEAGISDHPQDADAEAVGREHLRDTITDILTGSELISEAVAAGTLAIVGANYTLGDGRAQPDVVVGAL